MNTNRIVLSGAVVLSLLLSACGTKKIRYNNEKAPVRVAAVILDEKKLVVGTHYAHYDDFIACRATVQAEIALGAKSFSSKVNLQMAKGQGIKLSVVPFPLLEAVRVWFTPSEVVIVDVINGRYVQENYATLSEHLGFALDYSQIEALILGRVFAPGKSSSKEDIKSLEFTHVPNEYYQFDGQLRGLDYQFRLSQFSKLEKFQVLKNKQIRLFDAQYRMVSTQIPPGEATYTLYGNMGAKERGSLNLQWRRVEQLGNADNLQLTPNIKSKYERITLDGILKMIGGIHE